MMRVMVFLNTGSACVVKCATMREGLAVVNNETLLMFLNEKDEFVGKFKHEQVAGWAIIQEAETETEKPDKLPLGEKLQ